jgi:hypothetical protein
MRITTMDGARWSRDVELQNMVWKLQFRKMWGVVTCRVFQCRCGRVVQFGALVACDLTVVMENRKYFTSNDIFA